METLSNLAFGLGVALSWQNVLYCFIGCFLGTLVGVLPGIGPVATVAMLLPFTFGLNPAPALIMLAGIYYGAQYGGSTTAILVNIPGESSSVVTTLDGYQMARRGRAGPALGIAAIGSFVAGCIATLVIAYFAPPLAELALKFSPAEYFSLMVFGLIAAVVLARGSLIKAIAMVCFGILLGLVGTDVNSGVIRFAFGAPELADGLGFVALAPAPRADDLVRRSDGLDHAPALRCLLAGGRRAARRHRAARIAGQARRGDAGVISVVIPFACGRAVDCTSPIRSRYRTSGRNGDRAARGRALARRGRYPTPGRAVDDPNRT